MLADHGNRRVAMVVRGVLEACSVAPPKVLRMRERRFFQRPGEGAKWCDTIEGFRGPRIQAMEVEERGIGGHSALLADKRRVSSRGEVSHGWAHAAPERPCGDVGLRSTG
jgi:hypothetical protein